MRNAIDHTNLIAGIAAAYGVDPDDVEIEYDNGAGAIVVEGRTLVQFDSRDELIEYLKDEL